MPGYEELTQRAGSLRSMTGLTEAEFMVLLPHFEQAFVAYMQHRTIDGNARTSRRYSTYETCPLPMMADKLLFIEAYQGVIPAERHRAITKKARKTNHIERFNNTLRQRVSRLVRETLSFSKKLANHIGAIKHFICHYNLTRTIALPV